MKYTGLFSRKVDCAPTLALHQWYPFKMFHSFPLKKMETRILNYASNPQPYFKRSTNLSGFTLVTPQNKVLQHLKDKKSLENYYVKYDLIDSFKNTQTSIFVRSYTAPLLSGKQKSTIAFSLFRSFHSTLLSDEVKY
jgi:hypothetical protein